MVPGAWEYQGFVKYDGFARYRRTFAIPPQLAGKPLVLLLGWIDDFDKTYVNGQLVGTTNDHRRYGESKSYNQQRAYEIPSGVIKSGTNTIEVLVEDMGNYGGIWGGVIGITTREDYRRHFR
jgi:sialate O-acetylesterase